MTVSRRVNQLKMGAILSYLSMGLGYGISILYTPIMLRLLGQSEYGLYNLVASLVAYLGILNFGFGSAYIRYFSRYNVKDDYNRIAILNGMFLIIYIVLGMIALFAGIFLVANIEMILGSKLNFGELRIARILMTILIINISISFPGIVFDSHIIANEEFIFQKIMQVIRTVANPLLVLPVLFWGYGSIGMVTITTILNLIVVIANIIFCLRKLHIRFNFKKFDFKLMKEVVVFSTFILLNMITDQANWNVDKLILGRFHGTTTIAVYGLAAQLNMYYISLSTAISTVFIPRVHRIAATADSNHELTQLFTRVARIQFIFLSMLLTGLVLFGKPFIVIWAGLDYRESYQISLLLFIPVTIPLIQNLGIEIQRAKNMHQFRSWLQFFIAVGNVFLSIPLARSYGGTGVAAGTALALIIGNCLIMNWYYHYKIDVDMKYFWRQIVSFAPSLIPPVLVGILLNIYINLYDLKAFMLSSIIYLVSFSLSMWFFGMNQHEKNLISKPFQGIKLRVQLQRSR